MVIFTETNVAKTVKTGIDADPEGSFQSITALRLIVEPQSWEGEFTSMGLDQEWLSQG